MNQDNVLRIIIFDDNTAIHHDFIKILLDSAKQEDIELSQLEKKFFNIESQKKEMEKVPQFEIETASQGQEGVKKIAAALKENKHFALAFVDIRMPPGWDGIETIKRIWELDSNVQVVICTAYSDYTWEETVKELGKKDNLLILKKPFDSTAVRQIACALTKKWQLARETAHFANSLESRIQERTAELNKSLSLMRATLESSADGILVVNNDGKISNYNQKFLEIFGFSKKEIQKFNFDELTKNIIDKIVAPSSFISKLKKISSNHKENNIGNITMKNKKVFEYYTQPYTLSDQTLGRVWSFRDISVRAVLEEKLQYQATHDALTGLPNRILLLDKVKQAIVNAERSHTQFAILFLDLDQFKLVNDSLNHEAGDEVLCQVAERIKQNMRKENTFVRLGGDEFVIILENIKDKHDVVVFCNKIIKLFTKVFSVQGHELMLSTSIGVSIYPNNGKTVDLLLRNSDSAMYIAKASGNNQFQFYTENLNKKCLSRLESESELRRALEYNEFILYYQPQIDTKDKKLVSMEALIRWQHPKKGIILPLDFIPVAEESGLIIPIGEWVLRSACKQNKAWQDMGLPPIRIAVNVTTKQLRLFNFVETVKSILNDTKLNPEYLELELTENMIISNLDMIKIIHRLKDLGLQISLDDFGTGYSSLNYLREIPVDRLKIDQSYIQNIENGRGDDAIIQAIIAMARSLNLEVLAEGVETERQLEFLKKQKCAKVQGFYLSRPISSYECEKLLKEYQKKNVSLTRLI